MKPPLGGISSVNSSPCHPVEVHIGTIYRGVQLFGHICGLSTGECSQYGNSAQGNHGPDCEARGQDVRLELCNVPAPPRIAVRQAGFLHCACDPDGRSVQTLESLMYSENHNTKLVRFAHKTYPPNPAHRQDAILM